MASKFCRIEDGKPETINTEEEYLSYACCDCGLVHHIEIKILDDARVELIFTRSNRATGQLRRHKFGYLYQARSSGNRNKLSG